MKKLSEVAKLVGLLRQRIQEYEKAGIAFKPKVKNSHGDWLYGEAEIERLWQIKFYLTLGLTVPKMKAIFADPNYNKHDAIADQIIKLEEQKKDLEKKIEIARAYNEMDALPSDIWAGKGNLLEGLSYKTITPFMAKVGGLLMKYIKEAQEQDLPEEDVLVDWPTEDIARKWIAAVEKVGESYVANIDYRTTGVQEQISIMHSVDINMIPNSLVKCWFRTYYMVSFEYEERIKEAFGEEGFQYVMNALDFYAQEQMNRLGNVSDFESTPVGKTLENLQDYGLRHFTAGSVVVQAEVRKLHQMISYIGIFSDETQIRALTDLSNLLGSPEAKNALDNGRERGVCWFISRAIQIYCKHQQEAMTKEGESNE